MALQVNRYPLPILGQSLAKQVPCSRSGCPVGTDIPALVQAVRSEDHAEAYAVARGSNPFASSCGHGCHAPCESSCRRGAAGAPVAIGALEAFATAYSTPALTRGRGPCTSPHDVRSVAASRTEYGQRVAIVGGGAAGLACAHDLALLGHRPVVFDEGGEPGGVITRVIPESRFPTAAARAECLSILAGAVEYRSGVTIAGRGSIDELFARGFAAVFLASGCWERSGTHQLDDADDAMRFLADDHALEGDTIVIGDGDLALDAAREIARRAHHAGLAQHTTLVLTSRIEEECASPHMIAAAHREGVAVHNGWLPAKLLHDRQGAVAGVEITRDGGRTRRVLPAMHVVDATRRSAAARLFGVEPTSDGLVRADAETLETSRPRVFAGGACAFGHRSIAHAVADGKRAAWQIHGVLIGARVTTRLVAQWVEAHDHDEERSVAALAGARASIAGGDIPPADPFSPASVSAPSVMAAEASRCFDCTVMPVIDDECTSCGRCVERCPAGAIAISAEVRRAIIDGDRCTRCTLCVEACPEGSITLARLVWEERLEFERRLAPVAAPEGAYRPAVRSLTPR